MKLSDFKQKTKKWNCFAATDTLGSFDFYTSTISLDALILKDVVETQNKLLRFAKKRDSDKTATLEPDSYRTIAKVLPLSSHEYTHFIDATSTIWGLHHLLMMKEAYEADDRKGGTEASFYKAKRFYDHIRTLRLPNYYTLRDSLFPNTTPWQYKFTAGKLFTSRGEVSNRTVIFTHFLNNSGQFLVRSPLSTVSLLEASAMAQELFSNLFLLANTAPDFRAVEGALFSQKLMEYLYDPSITEYSVCVHLVANLLSLTDPIVAFQVCARLINIVLCMPTNYFLAIEQQSPIADIIGSPADHQMVKYLKDGLKSHDYGTLFYLLCCALPTGDYSTKDSINAYVKISIERLGINIEEMKSEARSEAAALLAQLENAAMSEVLELAKAGHANFTKIAFDRERLPFERLNLPPAILSDLSAATIFANEGNQLSTFNPEIAFNNLYDYGQRWVERFSEACL